MNSNNFKPVTFESQRKVCLLPFAVTVSNNSVIFRISRDLSLEGKMKPGMLFSLFYDDGPALFALVEDPENKYGEARRLACANGKGKISSLNITFPRTDLLKRIWTKESKITGLPLFEKRGIGKIVFHAPTGK